MKRVSLNKVMAKLADEPKRIELSVVNDIKSLVQEMKSLASE